MIAVHFFLILYTRAPAIAMAAITPSQRIDGVFSASAFPGMMPSSTNGLTPALLSFSISAGIKENKVSGSVSHQRGSIYIRNINIVKGRNGGSGD